MALDSFRFLIKKETGGRIGITLGLEGRPSVWGRIEARQTNGEEGPRDGKGFTESQGFDESSPEVLGCPTKTRGCLTVGRQIGREKTKPFWEMQRQKKRRR